MTWLECVCGHSLASAGDFAYSSHFFAAADWQEAGEQILEAMARLLAADGREPAIGEDGKDDGQRGGEHEDEGAMTGVVYACAHCGRRWLRLSLQHG